MKLIVQTSVCFGEKEMNKTKHWTQKKNMQLIQKEKIRSGAPETISALDPYLVPVMNSAYSSHEPGVF